MGGIVAESRGKYWARPGSSEVKKKPVLGAQLGGKATVLASGKREEVWLGPDERNGLPDKLAAPVFGKMAAVLQLTVGSKPATVRFAVG